jgi:hypothetical protein
MPVERGLIPPGPSESHRRTDDLLEWMGRQFATFGDIHEASIYGTSVYAVREMDFAYHVLVENSQNYVKGQLIERVALLLGERPDGERRRAVEASAANDPAGVPAQISWAIGAGHRFREFKAP